LGKARANAKSIASVEEEEMGETTVDEGMLNEFTSTQMIDVGLIYFHI
jgi:hypothetical protein